MELFWRFREASFLNGRKSLNASQPENYDRGYALDYYRYLGRIVASRLLGFPCRWGLNPPSFGDRCDCAGNKARDRSRSLGLEPQGSKGTASRCTSHYELLDLTEMLMDWKAASERHPGGMYIARSVEITATGFRWVNS
jgi:hypothetical protein